MSEYFKTNFNFLFLYYNFSFIQYLSIACWAKEKHCTGQHILVYKEILKRNFSACKTHINTWELSVWDLQELRCCNGVWVIIVFNCVFLVRKGDCIARTLLQTSVINSFSHADIYQWTDWLIQIICVIQIYLLPCYCFLPNIPCHIAAVITKVATVRIPCWGPRCRSCSWTTQM